MTSSLLDLLQAQGLLDAAGLAQLRAAQRQAPDERLPALLLRLALLSEERLLQAMAEWGGVQLWPAGQFASLVHGVRLACQETGLTQAMARRFEAVLVRPPAEDQGAQTGWWLVARDLERPDLQDWLSARGLHAQVLGRWLIAARDLDRVLHEVFETRSQAVGLPQDLRRMAEDAPVVELVNGVLARATDYRASDIHIEPHAKGFGVRYRVDGVLRAPEFYTRERFDAVVSRIKLISGLDIAERRLPQDGRFSARMSGVETDVRVSVIPSVAGESLVLRLLPNTQGTRFDIAKLGMEEDHLALYRSWMREPDGIVLVTGPTGSGKSTTLYATLSALDTSSERVMTVEDPVEYQVEGVTQFQVHSDIGFDFAAALRAMLRHDPDTIMVGEIRDVETARIAVQSSLTGHRVFSTLHTNDTATAFLRLTDMGVEPFLVAATVRGVVAQRLVRRLCDCAKPLAMDQVPPDVAQWWAQQGLAPETWRVHAPFGCARCSHTGYRGRMAVYELLAAGHALRTALVQSPSLQSLRQAVQPGFRALREDALLKVVRGLTSLEDALSLGSSSFEA